MKVRKKPWIVQSKYLCEPLTSATQNGSGNTVTMNIVSSPPPTKKTEPCFSCGKKLPLDDGGSYRTIANPMGGTDFEATGNYGSGVWDPMCDKKTLRIVICDKCMVKFVDRVLVVERHKDVRVFLRGWREHRKEERVQFRRMEQEEKERSAKRKKAPRP